MGQGTRKLAHLTGLGEWIWRAMRKIWPPEGFSRTSIALVREFGLDREVGIGDVPPSPDGE